MLTQSIFFRSNSLLKDVLKSVNLQCKSAKANAILLHYTLHTIFPKWTWSNKIGPCEQTKSEFWRHSVAKFVSSDINSLCIRFAHVNNQISIHSKMRLTLARVIIVLNLYIQIIMLGSGQLKRLQLCCNS